MTLFHILAIVKNAATSEYDSFTVLIKIQGLMASWNEFGGV
jgi:hypothetical protein